MKSHVINNFVPEEYYFFPHIMLDVLLLLLERVFCEGILLCNHCVRDGLPSLSLRAMNRNILWSEMGRGASEGGVGVCVSSIYIYFFPFSTLNRKFFVFFSSWDPYYKIVENDACVLKGTRSTLPLRNIVHVLTSLEEEIPF